MRRRCGGVHRQTSTMLLVCVFSTAILMFGPVGAAASHHRLLTNGKVKIAILDPMESASASDRYKRSSGEAEQTLSRQKRISEDQPEKELSRQRRPESEEEALSRQKRRDTTEELSRQKRTSGEPAALVGQTEEELSRQKRKENEEAALSRQKRTNLFSLEEERISGTKIKNVEQELSRQKKNFEADNSNIDDSGKELSGQTSLEEKERESTADLSRDTRDRKTEGQENELSRLSDDEDGVLSRVKRRDLSSDVDEGGEEEEETRETNDSEKLLSRQKRISSIHEVELSRQKRTDDSYSASSEDKVLTSRQRFEEDGQAKEPELSRQKRTFENENAVNGHEQYRETEPLLMRKKRIGLDYDVNNYQEHGLAELPEEIGERRASEPNLSRQKRFEDLQEMSEERSSEKSLSREERIEDIDKTHESRTKRVAENAYPVQGNEADTTDNVALDRVKRTSDTDEDGASDAAHQRQERASNINTDAEDEEERLAVMDILQRIERDAAPITAVEEPPRHTRNLLEAVEEYPPLEEPELLSRKKRSFFETDHEPSSELILSRQKKDLQQNKGMQSKDLEDDLDPDEDLDDVELRKEQREDKRRRKMLQAAGDRDVEEEDGWEQELRYRQELADNNILLGIEKRRERKERADATGELTLLQRIHQDAIEILRRQAEERNNAREFQARDKKNRELTPEERRYETFKKPRDFVSDEGSLVETENDDDATLLSGKRDRTRDDDEDDDELEMRKEVAADTGSFEMLMGAKEKRGNVEREDEDEKEKPTALEDEEEISRDLLTGKRVGIRRVKRDLGEDGHENDGTDNNDDNNDDVNNHGNDNEEEVIEDNGNFSNNEERVDSDKRSNKNKKNNADSEEVTKDDPKGSSLLTFSPSSKAENDDETKAEPTTQRPLTEVEAAILNFRRLAESGQLNAKKKGNNRQKRSMGRRSPAMSRQEREDYYKSIGLPLLSVPAKRFMR